MIHQLGHSSSKAIHLAAGDASDFRSQVVRWSWITFVIASLYQSLFHMDIVNLVALFCVALGWFITTRIFLEGPIMEEYPLSSFLVLAFGSSQLYLPLLFTTLEGKSLVYNLELPEQVFLHSLAGLAVIIIAHAFYRYLAKMNLRWPYPLLTKAGFFTPPTDLQLWLFGFVGLASTYYIYFISPEVGAGITVGTALDKVIQALVPFSYAPFFIPLGKLYGKDRKFALQLVPVLIAFSILLLALSVGRNSRGAFMIGFTSVGFAYVLGLLLGVFRTRLFTVRNAVIAGALFWLLTGPMADLGTAMVIVRAEREEIPAAELIDLTLEAFDDKKAIYERRIEDNSSGFDSDWNERYLDNIFTARFANIKYNDLSLICASKLSEHDPDMLDFSRDYALAFLPEPFLEALNFNVDKEQVSSISIGDYLYAVSGGSEYGGYRTGHFAGTGMATFGWWYLLLLGVGMVPVFMLFDIFVLKNEAEKSGVFNFRFSACVLLSLTSIWQFLPNESVVVLPNFLIRGWAQLCLLYFVLFQSTRFFIGIFKIRVKWGS